MAGGRIAAYEARSEDPDVPHRTHSWGEAHADATAVGTAPGIEERQYDDETAPTPTSATGTSFGGWVWFGLGSDCYVARQIAWGAGLTEPAILIDTSTAGDSASTSTEEFLYYRLDALGSVIGLTDEQGDLVERYTYDPYGQVHIETNGGGWTWRHPGGMAASKYDNPLAFTGHRFDAATGLHAAHFRHYSPRLGRWLSRDPAGYIDGVNLYEYVGGMPVGAVDPLGLSWLGDTWLGVQMMLGMPAPDHLSSDHWTEYQEELAGEVNDITNDRKGKIEIVAAVGGPIGAIAGGGTTFVLDRVQGEAAGGGTTGGHGTIRIAPSVRPDGGGTPLDQVYCVGGPDPLAHIPPKLGPGDLLDLTGALNSGDPAEVNRASQQIGLMVERATGQPGVADYVSAGITAIVILNMLDQMGLLDAPSGSGPEPNGECGDGLSGAPVGETTAQRVAREAKERGYVENPNRPGSYGTRDADGRFREKIRVDEAQPGAPGNRGRDHIHIDGGKEHLPPDTPVP